MKTIYVKLLNEGSQVFRPVSSTEVDTNIYKLGDLETTGDEKWEFAPGSIVLVEERIMSNELVLVAIKIFNITELSSTEQIKNASKASSKSRAMIEKSKMAGCFYCTEIFPVLEIKEWIDNGLTPVCPKCGVDSVLGDALGYFINKKNLELIHKNRFE